MPGLVLRLNYGGAKVWRALHYVKKFKDGKWVTVPTTHKLGRYPHLKLKDAREAARKFLADPQKALAQADSGSFHEVAENFIKRHVEASNLRSQPEIERCLAKYIYPAWGQRPFREIKRGDVAALLDRIVDNHGAHQADWCWRSSGRWRTGTQREMTTTCRRWCAGCIAATAPSAGASAS
jgi:hypothetical protein